MQKVFFSVFFLLSFLNTQAQKQPILKGMYFQWGYNTEWYTKSDVHIKMSNGNNFTIHNGKATDKPDLDAILKKPFEVSIPQYNYRLGFYLNKTHTKAIEINFDHIKYVLKDGQTARVSGVIDGVNVDADSVLNPSTFLHLEHTDGGNLLHINYVQQNKLITKKSNGAPLLNLIWKVGAGINIPRTDFTWRGDRLNNNFHIAGYNISAESGARVYPFKNIFFEFTAKSGFVNYLNALANTNAMKGNRVNHNFGYFELIGLIGYDLNF